MFGRPDQFSFHLNKFLRVMTKPSGVPGIIFSAEFQVSLSGVIASEKLLSGYTHTSLTKQTRNLHLSILR